MYYSKAGTLGDDTVVDSKAQQSVHCRDHCGNEPQLRTGILQYTWGKIKEQLLKAIHSLSTNIPGWTVSDRDRTVINAKFLILHAHQVTEKGRQCIDGQNTQHVYHRHS